MKIIENLPFGDYCDLPRVNATALKKIHRSPAHYRFAEREETAALVIGHATHTAVLEADIFLERYAVFPEGMTKTTKEGKETWGKLEATGKSILRFAECQAAQAIADAVQKHPGASKLLKNGRPELTVLSEIDGIETKIRIDYYIEELGLLIDIKTTEDARPDAFSRSIAAYGYDLQAAFYLDNCRAAGLAAETFLFIAVEKKPPYAMGVYELDLASMEVGRTKYQRALALWKHCTEVNEWPGYTPDIVTLQLPAWALREAA